MGVSPFRNPWVTGYVRLSTAFRSLSRLSSALSAKASTLRSFLLNLANPSKRWIVSLPRPHTLAWASYGRFRSFDRFLIILSHCFRNDDGSNLLVIAFSDVLISVC